MTIRKMVLFQWHRGQFDSAPGHQRSHRYSAPGPGCIGDAYLRTTIRTDRADGRPVVALQLSKGAAWMMSHTFGISRPCTRRRPMSAKPVPIAVCGFFLATSAKASVNAAFIPIRG